MQEDSILKKYLSDNERYADLINGLGFIPVLFCVILW